MEQKKIIAIALVAVVAIAAIAGGIIIMNNNQDNRPTLTIASSPDFIPYDYQVGLDWAGIDMDVCIAVANEIGYKCNFVSVEFDSIIPGISTGKYDMGASGFSITEERKESVLFSDSYAKVRNVVVVPNESTITTLEQAKAAHSGAQNGTTGHLLALDAGFNITSYKTYSDVFQNLRQGKIDCMVLDSDTALSFTFNPENEGKFKIVDGIKIGEDELYAFTFKLDNTELRDKFNTGLKTVIDNGTVQNIIDYYTEKKFSGDTPSYWKTH